VYHKNQYTVSCFTAYYAVSIVITSQNICASTEVNRGAEV